MIFYLVTADHAYTIRSYLKGWAPELRDCIKIIRYELLPPACELPSGTYIFSDLERLSDTNTSLGVELWDQLSEAGPRVRLLNHPQKAMRRYELLNTLYERGINKFRVYRLNRRLVPQRFPVFVHSENMHEGTVSRLLKNQMEIRQVAWQIFNLKGSCRQYLLEEFCDTSDREGIFRKYGAFCIQGKVIPRHLLFGRNWVLKNFDLLDSEKVQEIRDYLEQNPHERKIREIFHLAHIDYGRIDYSLLNGQIQVWEINTNPMILSPVGDPIWKPEEITLAKYFLQQINPVFRSLDLECPPQPLIKISLSHQFQQESVPALSSPPRQA